jgi:uncharacterized surface protein with fasciclin (FAS1) repeats
MKNKILIIVGIITVFAAAFVLSRNANAQEAIPEKSGAPDIVVVAVDNSSLSTLVAAIKAAGLVEALQAEGPFTVFAPNNDAFAKLPTGALEDLLKPENKMKLAGILKNHVVKGRVMAADVKPGMAKTLNGKKVELAKPNGKVTYGGAAVIEADIPASNGVIHIIDTVVMAD